jgi:hypothetical protein
MREVRLLKIAPSTTCCKFNKIRTLFHSFVTYTWINNHDRLSMVVTSSQLTKIKRVFCTTTFVGAIFHLQKLEKPLQSFKICHRTTLFEKMPNCHKLDLLFSLSALPPFSSWTATMSKPLAVYNFSFFTCELVGQIEYYLIATLGLAIVHFCILKCLIKESNFDTNSLSLPFTLEQTRHLTMCIFPSFPQNGSNQQNLVTHHC